MQSTKLQLRKNVDRLINELPAIFPLIQILQYKRPHGSTECNEMINNCIVPVLKDHADEWWIDGSENLYAMIGDSETIFSCHTDTVHWKGGYQSLDYDIEKELLITAKDKSFFKKSTYSRGECLGADDGAGIFICLELIKAKIPGLYLFHYGEESGGLGSSWIASKQQGMLKQYKRAIAFDRAGYGDVITHQFGGRCCSDTFAAALADALNNQDDQIFMYSGDPTGSFTDTANYTDTIPECTNLSVGYDHQHSDREVQNPWFLVALADACKKIDWESLPVSRDPSMPDPDDVWKRNYYGYGYDMNSDFYGRGSDGYKNNVRPIVDQDIKQDDFHLDDPEDDEEIDLYDCPYFLEDCNTWTQVYNWIRSNPDEAADALCETMNITRVK